MSTRCLPLLWDHWTSGYDCDVQDRRRWDGMEVALARLTWLLRSQYAVEKQSILVLPGQASQWERLVQPRAARVCRAPFAIRRPERKVTLSVCYHKGRGFVVRGEETHAVGLNLSGQVGVGGPIDNSLGVFWRIVTDLLSARPVHRLATPVGVGWRAQVLHFQLDVGASNGDGGTIGRCDVDGAVASIGDVSRAS